MNQITFTGNLSYWKGSDKKVSETGLRYFMTALAWSKLAGSTVMNRHFLKRNPLESKIDWYI